MKQLLLSIWDCAGMRRILACAQSVFGTKAGVKYAKP